MNLMDRLRALFGQSKHDDGATEEQLANREEADRALEAMNRRR